MIGVLEIPWWTLDNDNLEVCVCRRFQSEGYLTLSHSTRVCEVGTRVQQAWQLQAFADDKLNSYNDQMTGS